MGPVAVGVRVTCVPKGGCVIAQQAAEEPPAF